MILNRKRYEGLLFYKKKGARQYILVDHNTGHLKNDGMCFECIDNLTDEEKPIRLCSSSIPAKVLYSDYSYITVGKMPLSWLNAFLPYIDNTLSPIK